MSALDFGLGLLGVPQETIDKLSADEPAFARLKAELVQAEPILTKMRPLIVQLMPIIQKSWPDLVSVYPAIQDLIAFGITKQ